MTSRAAIRSATAIQHANGIEVAIRVVTTSWTLALLGEQAWMEGRDAPMGLLAQQALWCVSQPHS